MKYKKPLSTPFYLVLVNGLTLFLGFIIFGAFNIYTLQKTAIIQTHQNLKTFAISIGQLIRTKSNLLVYPSQEQYETSIDFFLKQIAANNPKFRISLIDATGKVVGDSDYDIQTLDNHGNRDEIKNLANGKEDIVTRTSTMTNKLSIYYALSFNFHNQMYILRLSVPIGDNVFFSSSLRNSSLIVTAVILIIILIISFISANKVLKPLTELKKTTEEFQAGNLNYTPHITSPKEFVDLSISFQHMGQTICQNIQDISQSRDEFLSVFSSMTEGLVVFDKQLRIQKINHIAEELFSVGSNSNAIGKNLGDIIHNNEIIHFAEDRLIGEHPDINEIETHVIIHNDTELPDTHSILVRCVKMQETVTANTNYLLVVTDITQLKRLERVRKDFVANVSHELKTPITAIHGFIETLQDGAIEEKDTATYFLNIMDQQTIRLSNIVNDLLTLSKLEQDGVAIEMARVNLDSIVMDVLSSNKHTAETKNISIEYIRDVSVDNIMLNGNKGLLTQAIDNIVSNSLKYCPQDSRIIITSGIVKEKHTRDTDSSKLNEASKTIAIKHHNFVKLTIEDTGNGIPPKYRKRIFERFYRIDKGRSREKGGTGLGLSIVLHIIQLHNGSIKCISRKNNERGACFEIMLPL
ncbi:MAG: cell wall metabolism sensor histidine kinase WalK [Candidatus Treponema excrementipullorum]|uniref:histidine kinase n=1 Tax=Candidatus Treponema excrementipullorum TaxID=2838768 RepID=A0A9E2L2G4_9SPIR|nr:cell wall metabolism sensor histidine kinase WalK [Candidatus Treponema excrementipullorum]